MKTQILLSLLMVLCPSLYADWVLKDDAPTGFIHLEDKSPDSKPGTNIKPGKIDCYVPTSKISEIQIRIQEGDDTDPPVFVVSIRTTGTSNYYYELLFATRDAADKCAIKLMNHTNQGEQAASSNGDKPSN